MSKENLGRVLRIVGRVALASAVLALIVGGIFHFLQAAGVDVSARFAMMAIPIAIVMEMGNAKRAGRPSRIAGS